MRITSWNINSVRLRIDQVIRFTKEQKPDVLCLQEIKCNNDQFPEKAFRQAGYEHLAVAGQKAYHGVAIASRLPLDKIEKRDWCAMGDARHIAARVDGKIELHNFYVPAGGDEADPKINPKFDHKLKFLKEMEEWSAGLKGGKKNARMLVGDLNIAPDEHDVWSHKQLLKVVSHTPIEVDRLSAIIKAGGWEDIARTLVPSPEKLYSWWSYRSKDWRASNRGRRLDHIWVNAALSEAASAKGRKGFTIHDEARDWVKPSDHAPISIDLDI